jgi:hypothetical protein
MRRRLMRSHSFLNIIPKGKKPVIKQALVFNCFEGSLVSNPARYDQGF